MTPEPMEAKASPTDEDKTRELGRMPGAMLVARGLCQGVRRSTVNPACWGMQASLPPPPPPGTQGKTAHSPASVSPVLYVQPSLFMAV